MKKIICLIVLSVLVLTSNSFAQPHDLSFLTNRAALGSHLLRSVNEIHRQVNIPAGTPDGWNVFQDSIPYRGAATLSAMSSAMRTKLECKVPIPNADIYFQANLKGQIPGSSDQQDLIIGGMYQRAINDGRSWNLRATPEMHLAGAIWIPYPNIKKAWVAVTNQYGWVIQKELHVIENYALLFETSLCGQIYLCTEEEDQNGNTSNWTYNLTAGGNPTRQPFTTVMVTAVLESSQDFRDYVNTNSINLRLYTYRHEETGKTFGVVPTISATYTSNMTVSVTVDSAVGSAREYRVIQMRNGVVQGEQRIVVDPDKKGFIFNAVPSEYHFIPLGINVTQDWWILTGGESGKG
ncbi:MAG: hypothetical protein M3Q80_02225 [bacterium]|nr:hypothetical protein [bacterium]